MTERIDHASQARNLMLDVGADEHGTVALELLDESERWVYEVTMREAQVHATLALVEQQRIANLLALAQFRWTDGASQTHFFTALEAAKSLRFEAAEALGLEP